VTFAELKGEVFRRLRESSTLPVFWTEDDVEGALNEGYAEISDASEWYEIEATIDLLDSRPYYDLRTLIADPVLTVTAAFNDQTNRWLDPGTVEEFDHRDVRWERVTGEPQRVCLRGLWWLRFWPMVTDDAGTVRVKLTTIPRALVEDDDEPGFAAPLHEGLVDYALADLWAQDAETTKALASWRRYLAYEDALTRYSDGRLSVPMVSGLGQ
jgi:hypothetical protein